MFLSAVGLKTHIYNNNLKSVLLLAGFPFLLLCMIGAFSGGLSLLSLRAASPFAPLTVSAFKAGAFQGIYAYGHYAFLVAGIWFVIAYLFQGQIINMATAARPVTRTEMPRIYNLLENLCISRGLAVPRFEVIDSPALNAFATGINDSNYKIVLTRGLIDCLDDDELEAVIAHELTHIINRDVRLLIVSVIFVGMISFMCEMVFRLMMNGGRRANYYSNDRDRGSGFVIMLLALVILSVGYLLAIVIRFALSRKREYLADAGAVELTHKPEALMRALLRIQGRDQIGPLPGNIKQMCIENSMDFMGLFATHPSIRDRVQVISRMTATPIPDLQVSLRRPPDKPWGEAIKA